MSGFETSSHPLAEDMGVLASAFEHGIAEELPYMRLLKGFEVNVIPGEDLDDGSTYMRMEVFGGRSLVEYKMAPILDVPNPLVVIEADEGGDIVAKPVLARMVVSSQVLIPVGRRGDLPLKASQIQVDVLGEGAVMSMNESLGINPFFGEFDGTAYSFIRNKSYEDLHLGYVVRWARDFLKAA